MIAFALASVLAGGAAPGPVDAVTVLGSTTARACYEAASGDRRGGFRENLALCTEALARGNLSAHDLTATHVNRGIIRVRAGDMDGGVADFDTALTLHPRQPQANLNKAIVLLRRGNWSDAIPLFSRALESGTGRPELAYFGRAVALEQAGRIAAAYHDYRRAAAARPDWPDPRVELRRFRVTPRRPAG